MIVHPSNNYRTQQTQTETNIKDRPEIRMSQQVLMKCHNNKRYKSLHERLLPRANRESRVLLKRPIYLHSSRTHKSMTMIQQDYQTRNNEN